LVNLDQDFTETVNFFRTSHQNSPPTGGSKTWTDEVVVLSKTPLLDRRGAETDERSESASVGWWNLSFILFTRPNF
jgi:hypothetical protein